jgi:hypothetical protein
MSNEPTRTRRLLVGALVFVVGFGAGGAVVAAFAAKASRAYLRGAQLTFATEQDRQLSHAWRSGDFEGALLHAGCALEAEHGEAAARTFDPARNKWSLSYALTEAIIVEPNMATFEKARPKSEGAARAKLGVVWERLGKAEAGVRELERAAQLFGNTDIAKWRRFGEQTVDGWSQVEEKLAREKAAAGAQPSR